MSARVALVACCLMLIALTGPLPLIYSSMQYVANARWATMYDNDMGCDLSASATQRSANGSKWCKVREVQIVGRTPSVFDAAYAGTYSVDVEDSTGRTYWAKLVPTSAAMRSWMESGAPAPTMALFFANAPVLIDLAGTIAETKSNPDFLRADSWLSAWRYAGTTLVELALFGLVALLLPSVTRRPDTVALRSTVYRRTG